MLKNAYLGANLASIQPRTSPFKFARSPRTDPPGVASWTRWKETRESELADANWMEHADQSLKKDMAVNLCAYDAMNGHALMYVDESLKKHKDVVPAALSTTAERT